MLHTPPLLRADTHVHQFYARHAALPVGVVTQCAANHATMVQAVWQALPGDGFAAKVRRFYEDGEECLFDLLARATTCAAHLQALEQSGSWSWFAAAGDDVLDFGGGLGQTSSLLRQAGRRVTYVDVAGAIARFAEWCFAQQRLDVTVLRASAARAEVPGGRYDLVLAENVLEHLADPVAAIDALTAAVRPGGLLHVRIDPRPATPAEPHRRALTVDALLTASRRLAAMEHVQRSDDGRHVFRAG